MNRSYTNVVLSDEFEPIVRRTKGFLQACFYRALGNVTNPAAPALDDGTIENIVASFLRTRIGRGQGTAAIHYSRRELSRRARAANVLFQHLKSDGKTFGPLSDVDFSKKESVAAQLARSSQTLFSDEIANVRAGRASPMLRGLIAALAGTAAAPPAALKVGRRIDGRFFTIPALTENAATVPSPPPRTWTALELKITKLKCLDLVDEFGVDWGTDHINMGGEGDDSAGTKIQVNQFHVADFNQSNMTHTYGGTGHTFAKFNLAATPWTGEGRAFWGFITLAEKDADGGFLTFLQQLWDAINNAVVRGLTDAILAAAATAGIGATVGAAAATPETLGAGAIVGAVVGAVVGFLVGLILEALKDDVFEPIMTTPVWLPSQNALFENGTAVSPTYSDELSRDGARYKVWYNWVLS